VVKFVAAHISDSTGENLHFAHYTKTRIMFPRSVWAGCWNWHLGPLVERIFTIRFGWLVAPFESNTVWVVGWEREAEKHKSNFFNCTKNC